MAGKGQPPISPSSVSKQARDTAFVMSYERRNQRSQAWRVIAYCAGTGFVLVCMTPLANAIAGKNTTVNITVSLVFSLSVAGVAALTGNYARIKRNEVKRLRARNKALVQRLRDAGVSVPDSEIG